MLFSPLVHAVLTTIEVLSAESSNLPMVAAIACAVVGIILFVAAAYMKGNAQKQIALRLVGSFLLILTVSGAVSIRFEIPLLFVVGAIVAAAFILIPDFLTNQKKYQRVFRLIGILLLMIAIGGAVIRYRENPDNKDFSEPTTATNSDPNYSEHTSMPGGHIVNHTYPDGWTDEPSSADSSGGKAKEPVSEEHSWSGSLSAEGLGALLREFLIILKKQPHKGIVLSFIST